MQWLKQIYGKDGAMQIISNSNEIRRDASEKTQEQIRKYIEHGSKQVESQVSHLLKK